ncbi:hypothetical protein F9K94_15450 [Brucella tritici]|uniref:Uncharacterized protein n=1 Tax=Brucella tritici TaxID=94626 RepID=A0A7V7VS71_9HYPH|nr:hypothetical protein [Brucella tritici]KAB2655921.1 hypothetical protein F9K94_15450 [Brucella tritici]
MSMPNFTGHVVFCEDVRIEVNRQVSYIGVFPHHREFFEPDVDGDFVLPRFGIAIYLDIPPEYEGQTPLIAVLSIDKDGKEKQIADETMGKVPNSPDGRSVNGVSHIQLEGLFSPVGTKFGVDVTIKDETVRIGVFHSIERQKNKTKDENA